jgi:Ca2+/Na+ antiporter
MSADVAMTKKGFGEMAVTATIAGPIFNILVGQGLSNLITIVNNKGASISDSYINFSLTNSNGDFNQEAMLPLLIIIAELLVLTINLINVFVNQFKIGLKLALSTTLVYFSTVGYLVYYCITYNVAAGDG